MMKWSKWPKMFIYPCLLRKKILLLRNNVSVMNSKKILMAMSGGIDSSIAAMILKNQGYSLIGATYRTFDQISDSCLAKEKGCCSVDSIFEAKALAESMGFPHHILDIREEFKSSVIADFIEEYMHGRTPNPCVVCNSNIKWGKLMEIATELGCDTIATGHYARISKTYEGRYFLQCGVDLAKDQTYFLWKLSQYDLAHTVFPLGNLTKPEVRKMAFDAGYEKLSKKGESQEICFIPDNDYRHFLSENVKDFDKLCKDGNFVDPSGKIIGKHKGFPNYTIGQRKGLGVAFGEPRFVININAERNEVMLGTREDLQSHYCYVNQLNMMKYADFTDGFEVAVKVRYRSKAALARLFHHADGIARVEFVDPIDSITPGQSAVFYTGDDFADVLGGGVIIANSMVE